MKGTYSYIADERAMDLIQGKLSGVEWSPDTLDEIADIVRATGRFVNDMEDGPSPT